MRTIKLLVCKHNWLIILFFPFIFSLFYSFFKYWQRKTLGNALIFFFLLSIFFTYITLSYDNIMRFWLVQYHSLSDLIYYNKDALTCLMSLLTSVLFECSHVFALYSFLIWFFITLAIKNLVGLDKKTYIIATIFVFFIRNAIDLVYFSLSVSVLAYLSTCIGRIKLIYLFIIILFSLLVCHPGVLLVFFPAWPLLFLMNKRYYIYGIVYLFILFICLNFFFTPNNVLDSLGLSFIDANFIDAYNKYVSDSYEWGFGEKNVTGFVVYVHYFAFYVITISAFIFSFFVRKVNNLIVAILQVSFVLWTSSLQFVTFNERFMIVFYVFSVIFWLVLIKKLGNKLLTFVFCSFLILAFITHAYYVRRTPDQTLMNSGNSIEKVQMRVVYMPTFLLLFYEPFGFSDQFIMKYGKYKRPVGLKRPMGTNI
ncbi:hypothetical protein [Phocaeicola sp.]